MHNAVAKKTRRPSSRQAILEAAATLIAEVGASHLTLDAVAARAGVSKGGLLYNFPNKHALLTALIEQAIAEAMALLEEKEEAGALTPAEMIRAVFEHRFAWLCDAIKDPAAHGMLAALAEQPDLLAPIHRFHRAVWEKMKKAADDADGLWLIWLAGEGMMFADLFQVNPLTPEERKAIIDRLARDADRMLAGKCL